MKYLSILLFSIFITCKVSAQPVDQWREIEIMYIDAHQFLSYESYSNFLIYTYPGLEFNDKCVRDAIDSATEELNSYYVSLRYLWFIEYMSNPLNRRTLDIFYFRTVMNNIINDILYRVIDNSFYTCLE